MDSNELFFHGHLIDAIAKGDEVAVQHILNIGASVNKPDDNGFHPIHWASLSQETESLIPFLLSKGAEIDAKNNIGQTPLHLVCMNGGSFGAACLLHQGADANVQTSHDLSTPLHYAVQYNHQDIARLLMAYGAKSSIVNRNGERPKDLGLSDVIENQS
jgi:ankyrin repeat protein